MKKIYISLILTFLVLSFPTILMKNAAANGTTMNVNPASIHDIPVGSSFNITLDVADVQNLLTWQTKLVFNATILECTDAIYPTNHIFAGKPFVPVSPVIDNVGGSVLFGASRMGADTVSGGGIMCQLTFKVLAIGESELSYSTPYGKDTLLLNGDLDLITAAYQNGFFTNIPAARHDVAVTGLTLSNDHPKEGDSVTITVVVLNNGTTSETFNVSVFYDTTLIELQTVTSLAAGNTATLPITWNTTGVPLGPRTINATAATVPAETELANNVKTTTATVISANAASTDLDGDGDVDMMDIGRAARAFGTQEGDVRWNPDADIDRDGMVTLLDIALISQDFWR